MPPVKAFTLFALGLAIAAMVLEQHLPWVSVAAGAGGRMES